MKLGASFLFTGKLASLTRDDAHQRVLVLGGVVASSVTKKLDVLVVGGDERGAKLRKAETLNQTGATIQILSEQEFLTLAPPTKPARASTIVAPTTPPRITEVRPPTEEMVVALASDGDQLLVVNNTKLQAQARNRDQWLLTDQTGLGGICVRGDERWLCAYGHALVSRDRGKSFQRIDLVPDHPFYAIGQDAEGVWVAGHEGAVFLCGDRETFTKLGGVDKATFKRAVPSPFGMLLLKYNGRLCIGKGGKVKGTPLRAKSPLLDACVTATGAVVVVGHGNWNGAAFRTEDGTTFEPSTLAFKRPIGGIAAMSDGRIVAGGGDDSLFISYDDGRSFEVLEHGFAGAKRAFTVFANHDGAVYVADSFQRTLRIE